MSTLRIPIDVPSPAQDCEKLKNAFQGIGTDEKAIVRILGRRNENQRKKIRETYQQLHNKSLIDCLFSELSGDFRKVVTLWTCDPAERDAKLANEALKSWRKTINQLQIIVEIACASSPHHLVAVRQAYCSLFNSTLEEDIVLNVSPPVQKILVSLVSSYRYDKEVVDSTIAKMEAAKIRNAIEAKKLDDYELVQILSTRNIYQLRETFKCYKDDYGKCIDEDVMTCGKSILESIMKIVVLCIYSPEKHFAEIIRAAIAGLGTDEDTLNRAIVSRAEIDMVKVIEHYFIANKSSLNKAVIGDTSGDYQDFLLTLLGEDV